jgi:hypothetical protein
MTTSSGFNLPSQDPLAESSTLLSSSLQDKLPLL